MAVVVVAPFTPEQETRVRELADQAVVKFLASNVPGYTDPATGRSVTYATAIKRGTTAYPYVITGGYLEKRVKAIETGEVADDAAAAQMAQQLAALQQLEQTEAAEQDAIQAALAKPILPAGGAG